MRKTKMANSTRRTKPGRTLVRPPPNVTKLTRKVSTKKRIIVRTVGLAAGLIEGAPSRLAVEIARVVDDGTNLCVARSRRTDA